MSVPLHPPLCWAQRSDTVLITIPLQDCKNVSIKFTTSLSFTATSGGKEYECNLPLFDAVVPEESSSVTRPRQVEIKLQKKSGTGEYWPRLTKEKSKSQHIQMDWNRWKDEDDTKAGAADDLGDFGMGGGGGGMGGMDMQKLMAQMGGGGGGMDMPDFGSAGKLPDLPEDDMPPLEG